MSKESLYVKANRDLYLAQEELKKAEVDYRDKVNHLTATIAACRDMIRMKNSGLDLDLIKHAEKVIRVVGYKDRGRDGGGAVRDAIVSILNGGGKLREQYIATKNYSEWVGQREDHSYGMGPRHGSICFRIELTHAARMVAELTKEDIEAAVYYLNNLETIFK